MTDEPLNPIERLRVHLALEHHEEDADAFALVDSLIQSYALEYPDDLTTNAQELQNLLLDVIESWTPARVCAGCGNEDAIDNGLCQACVDHQYTSSDALRARVAELEEFVFLWCDPDHMCDDDFDFYSEITKRIAPLDTTKPPF